jgi:hypothetical protein
MADDDLAVEHQGVKVKNSDNHADSPLRARTRARLEELIEARDKFVTEANQRVVAFDTVIAELRQLLEAGD